LIRKSRGKIQFSAEKKAPLTFNNNWKPIYNQLVLINKSGVRARFFFFFSFFLALGFSNILLLIENNDNGVFQQTLFIHSINDQ